MTNFADIFGRKISNFKLIKEFIDKEIYQTIEWKKHNVLCNSIKTSFIA